MNRLKRDVLGCVIAALNLSGLTCAGDEPRWAVRSELLVFQMPLTAESLRVRAQLSDSKTIGPAIAQLMSGSGKMAVELIGIAITNTAVIGGNDEQLGTAMNPVMGGQPASESAEEIPYPTDFLFHGLPQNFGSEPRQLTLEEEFQMVYGIPSPIDVPVEFERRNAGVSLEVRGNNVINGQVVDLTVIAQNVVYLGTQIPPDENIANWRHRLPRFRSQIVAERLCVTSGHWNLLSVNVVNQNKPALEIMVFRATAISAEE